ncbi:MAG TPA: DUF2378 family protein [Polyangiaceae bacterium]|nr:DUF2378 family protein [Polyangiaceae bacterium]
MERTVTLADSLVGTLDPEAVAAQLPKSYVVKGMFFARLLAQLGPGFSAIEPKLEQPPRLGRYVPFSDYPQSDYVRVSTATAQKVFPGVPLREALRRLGREDFSVFAGSTVGKVILAVVGDARTALLRTPTIYMKMAPGDWVVTGEEVNDRVVRLQFSPVYGTWEYQVGQLEGLVMNYGGEPKITIRELPSRTLQFDVQHRD